ncbi:autotransporter outer membrane beta-barrel domain-containing protein [Leminorella grimontii]|uniref:autotransporter outer membrane beta-barrel domain-containing protein n=1 Tax=Leminorella grimontii TaxID=82981 RepID=UPI00322043BF
MKTQGKFKTNAFRKNLILVSMLPALASFSVSADSYWTNAVGNNQFLDANNWDTLTPPSLADGDLYLHNSGGQTVEFELASTYPDFTSGDGRFYIGHGAGNDARLKFISTTDNAYYARAYLYGDMVVGADEGRGLVEYSHGKFDGSFYGVDVTTLTIGSGLNSMGTVSLFGQGKTTTEQTMSNSTLETQEMRIGVDGGSGVLNVDGSSIVIDRHSSGNYTTAFSLGDGLNSQGTMNVLSGGKALVSSSLGYSPYTEPSAVIGVNQGRGALNISGSMSSDAGTGKSRAYFGQGLYVGHGADSVGSVQVTDGGRLATMGTIGDPSAIGAYVGVNGGTGSVLVSGEGSEWLVSGGTSIHNTDNRLGHLSIGESGTGSLTLANGGRVSVGWIDYLYDYDPETYASYYDIAFDSARLGDLYLGNQADGVGTLNIGGAENGSAQAVGTVEANSIVMGAGNGTLVFNHTDSSGLYQFDLDVVSSSHGQGTIKQVNGVTVFNTDRSAFTGKTLISGGTLEVNNVLGGTVSVSGSGTLAGIGSVGSTTVERGGAISPGAFNTVTPETLTVAGDLTMTSGAIYVTNLTTDLDYSTQNADGETVNTYRSDRIQVDGLATLGGANVLAVAGGNQVLYVPNSRWHILSATGGVSGEFGTLTARPYVDMDYEYDANNAYLVVTRNEQDICMDGMTSNECSVGGGVDEEDGGDIVDEIISQPDKESAKNALNQLSGEVHSSAKSAMLEDSRFLREAVNNRLRDPAVGTGAWGHIYTSWGSFDNSDSAAQMKRDIAGVILGVDRSLNETWTLGLAGGYGKANVRVSERASSADRYDYHVGAYTKGQWGNVNLHTGVGYTWHDVSTERSVRLQKLEDSPSADYNASTSQMFAEGRYLFEVKDGLALEPYAGAAYVHVETDGFTERGGKARLQGASDSMDTFFTTLSLRASKAYALDNGQNAKLWSNVGWRHAYNDVTPTTKMSFIGGKGFEVIGTSVSRDVAVLEVGAQIETTPSVDIGVTYNGNIGNSTEDHGAKIYFNWRF